MKLTAYILDGKQCDIRPAALDRVWMNATDQRFAYRCLPLNIANTHGWEILCPSPFTAIWGGEPEPGSVLVTPGSGGPPPAVSHFGAGMLTFHLGCIFRTEPGYDLVVQGPVNSPKDAIAALTGIVEADWTSFSFTMNWMFTQPEIEVEFAAGEPFCHIYPIRRGEIETFEPEILPLASDRELQGRFKAWSAGRRLFNRELGQPGSDAQAQRWQKHYFRGIEVTGQPGPTDHRTALKIRPFARISPALAAEPRSGRDLIAAAFDADFYLATYGEALPDMVDPLDDFLSAGWRAGRNPNADFDVSFYRRDNPEIAAWGENPFLHYLTIGRAEGRRTSQSPAFGTASRFPVVPAGTVIPDAHHAAAAASQVLCRTPLTDMLDRFRATRDMPRRLRDLEDWFRAAMVDPFQMRGGLAEGDLAIAAMLDDHKERLLRRYRDRPQTERVSVIMPTYERADVIADAILSVLLQSYGNWELLILDDAGDARTEAVVASFGDARIRYMFGGRRGGISAARNHALREARGTIVGYLDDDNLWDPDCLLLAVNAMRERGASMLFWAQVMWTGFDAQTRLGHGFDNLRFTPPNRSLLENVNYIDTNMCIHDRALLAEVGDFDEAIWRAEDWDLFLRLSEATAPVALPCVLSHYFNRRAPIATSVRDLPSDAPLVRAGIVRRSGAVTEIVTSGGERIPIFAIAERARRKRRGTLDALPVRRCGIVIPHRDGLPELATCLERIAAYTAGAHDIVVVDHGSSEPTRGELARLAETGGFRWIAVDPNGGFGAAIQTGVAGLPPDRDTVVMHSDALVTTDWLDELFSVLHRHSSAAIAASRQVLPAIHPLIRTHIRGVRPGFEADVTLSAFHGNVLDPEFDPADGLVELSYAPFACVLIRKGTFAALGPIEASHGSHDRFDHVFCNAVRHTLKQKIIYTPHSKVYHLEGITLQPGG